jgi:hypothetical protein
MSASSRPAVKPATILVSVAPRFPVALTPTHPRAPAARALLYRSCTAVGLAWYVTSGRSVLLITLMVESASGGSTSTSALEWRCSATLALGRSSSLQGWTPAAAAPLDNTRRQASRSAHKDRRGPPGRCQVWAAARAARAC